MYNQARAIRTFNTADEDGSGTIDEAELLNLLQRILPNITRPGNIFKCICCNFAKRAIESITKWMATDLAQLHLMSL